MGKFAKRVLEDNSITLNFDRKSGRTDQYVGRARVGGVNYNAVLRIEANDTAGILRLRNADDDFDDNVIKFSVNAPSGLTVGTKVPAVKSQAIEPLGNLELALWVRESTTEFAQPGELWMSGRFSEPYVQKELTVDQGRLVAFKRGEGNYEGRANYDGTPQNLALTEVGDNELRIATEAMSGGATFEVFSVKKFESDDAKAPNFKHTDGRVDIAVWVSKTKAGDRYYSGTITPANVSGGSPRTSVKDIGNTTNVFPAMATAVPLAMATAVPPATVSNDDIPF